MFSKFIVQAVHHGFGVAVEPKEIVPVNGKPLQDAITQVLANPSFRVSAIWPDPGLCFYCFGWTDGDQDQHHMCSSMTASQIKVATDACHSC